MSISKVRKGRVNEINGRGFCFVVAIFVGAGVVRIANMLIRLIQPSIKL